MIILKSERDLELMRPACVVAGDGAGGGAAFIQPGVTTREVDDFAAARIKFYGAKSAFLGYRKYPCHICISVNEQVVHGLAGPRRLEFGDIVSLDIGVRLSRIYRGHGADGGGGRMRRAGATVDGCDGTGAALGDCAGAAGQPGGGHFAGRAGIMWRATGYSVVREFVGHGVGRTVHEEPQVPNFVEAGQDSRRNCGRG